MLPFWFVSRTFAVNTLLFFFVLSLGFFLRFENGFLFRFPRVLAVRVLLCLFCLPRVVFPGSLCVQVTAPGVQIAA